MNILLAADGSRFTKKALAFVLAHHGTDPGTRLHILNVQAPLPAHVTRQLGKKVVDDYHREQAEKVLQPITRTLQRHGLDFSTGWCIGPVAEEIVRSAAERKSHLLVMGTHGHGLLGRLVLGSVAQRVVALSPVPVLLVK